jgi:2-dehydropantoate 2-reductase
VIAVLGPGGVGGLVAATLARAGEDVVVVAREETAEVIAAEGLRVRSVVLGEFVARPRVASVLDEPAEILVVATKATGLEVALTRVQAPAALVLPLLNGIEHVARLRSRFGVEAVCSGVIRVESDRPEPAVVEQTSPSIRIDLAPSWPYVLEAARRIGVAGIPTIVGEDEATVMWSKLVRLNSLALMTSAYDLRLGAIRDDPALASELEACVLETGAVAVASGAELDPADTLRELADAHPGLGSSMRRDIAAGREPELDAIPGAVVRAAERVGVEVPVVRRLLGRVAGTA